MKVSLNNFNVIILFKEVSFYNRDNHRISLFTHNNRGTIHGSPKGYVTELIHIRKRTQLNDADSLFIAKIVERTSGLKSFNCAVHC